MVRNRMVEQPIDIIKGEFHVDFGKRAFRAGDVSLGYAVSVKALRIETARKCRLLVDGKDGDILKSGIGGNIGSELLEDLICLFAVPVLHLVSPMTL